MKYSITETEKKDIDIKYFCADVGPRYWEDGDVNGEEDISYEEQEKGVTPKMPLAIENPNAKYNGEKYRWKIKIDLDTGNVVGWTEGIKANIHYKVCDDGTYWFEDTDGNKIHEIDSYVPEILDFYDDSYGDYIIMTINENGHIEEWYSDSILENRINSFFKNEGF